MGKTNNMSDKITTIDINRVGTKGYPHNWEELGLEPPTKEIEVQTRTLPTRTSSVDDSTP
jgi:hypothetical protein